MRQCCESFARQNFQPPQGNCHSNCDGRELSANRETDLGRERGTCAVRRRARSHLRSLRHPPDHGVSCGQAARVNRGRHGYEGPRIYRRCFGSHRRDCRNPAGDAFEPGERE